MIWSVVGSSELELEIQFGPVGFSLSFEEDLKDSAKLKRPNRILLRRRVVGFYPT